MAPGNEALKPQLVIPMTGISSRFTSAGYDRPKFMLEVDGQTVIEHVLDMYPDWQNVVFICNGIHLDDARLGLEALLMSRRPAARIVRLDGPVKGPGEAVLLARDSIARDNKVVVNYCDFTVYWNSDDLIAALEVDGVEGVIPVYTGFHPHTVHSTSYAYVCMDGLRAVDIQEKQPWTDNPLGELASTGTYGFSSGALLLDALDKQVERGLTLNGEYYLSLTYKSLLAESKRIDVLMVEHFMQWGTPQDFEEYRDVSRGLRRWIDPRISRDPADVGASGPGRYSRVLLASGAGSRFASAGYSQPKPVLPLSGGTVMQHALAGIPGVETVVVTRDDLVDHGLIADLAENAGYSVVTLPVLSRGQAESALAGLRALQSDLPVTVAACDALLSIDSESFDKAVHLAGTDGIVVWTAPEYPAANRKVEQYGWIASTSDGDTSDMWLKSEPADPKARVMVGTFTFPSRNQAIAAIVELLESGEQINGEFYLDSVARRKFEQGEPVIPFTTQAYLSVGTPAEYETVRYWQSCFHKWVHHPYSLVADPLVATELRAILDHDFRKFTPILDVGRDR